MQKKMACVVGKWMQKVGKKGKKQQRARCTVE
jgi:hypothetical protein